MFCVHLQSLVVVSYLWEERHTLSGKCTKRQRSKNRACHTWTIELWGLILEYLITEVCSMLCALFSKTNDKETSMFVLHDPSMTKISGIIFIYLFIFYMWILRQCSPTHHHHHLLINFFLNHWQHFNVSKTGWTTGFCYWITLDYTVVSNQLVADCLFSNCGEWSIFTGHAVVGCVISKTQRWYIMKLDSLRFIGWHNHRHDFSEPDSFDSALPVH